MLVSRCEKKTAKKTSDARNWMRVQSRIAFYWLRIITYIEDTEEGLCRTKSTTV